MLFSSVLAVSFCFITHPETTKRAVTDALSFCFSTLIPSLFPFAVAGEVLVSAGFGEFCGKLCGNRFMRGRGLSAFLLGAFCGFPIGGKTAISFYENGELERSEAELLCAVCNNAGAGFVIAGIGSAMWKSTSFGVCLYLVQLISAILTAYLLKPLFKRDTNAPRTRNIIEKDDYPHSVSSIISNAVPNAVFTMLRVSGFVVFFELLLSLVSPNAVLSVLLEITSGVTALLRLSIEPANEFLAKAGTFFAVGFGGLSVHMQLASFMGKSGISMYRYTIFKLLQAVLCAVFGAIILRFGIM